MADVSKIKLPDQSIVNIKDYRIPGVDTVPTSGSSNLITSGGVYQDMEDTSRVVSAALNDLNDRVVDIEDEWVTTEEFSQIEQAVRDTYTKQEIDVMIADLESGSVDNVVTQVNVGATPYNPSNGIVSLPAYPISLPASDVSSWAKSSTKPTYTATEVGAQEVLVSGTNIKTINNQSLLGSGNLTVPIKIYEFETTDSSAAYYGYITISWDTYQSIISDFANGISVAIRTKLLSDDEVVAEYEWHLEQKSEDGQYVFFRLAPNEYCRIFIYPPSTPGTDPGISAGPLSLSNFERTNNRVTSISSTSTNYTYPTAKAVYNAVQSGIHNLIYTNINVTGWSDISSGNYSVTTTTFNGFVSYYRDSTSYGIVFRNSSTVTSITFRQVFVCVGYENSTLYFTNADNGHIYTITWKIVNNAVEKTFTDINVSDLQSTLNSKQDSLVSGTNIKTINNQSLLGSGNITISGGGDTSTCVHLIGDETISDDKTFTDNIAVVDASHILYSGSSPSQGFTRGYATASGDTGVIGFNNLLGEPKAFIVSPIGNITDVSGDTIIAVVGDSTGCHAVYTTGTQHNYMTTINASYSNGSLALDAGSTPTFFGDFNWQMVYYYGDGTLTFKTSQVQPGSGATTATFTGASLTELPAFYAIMLESAVNNESYRRVAYYTNEGGGSSATPMGVSFFSSQIHNTTSSFTVSYNNGLVINSGGTNAGGYFHNPGTYTLYYLTASDIGGDSGSYNSLKDELDDIRNTISGIETLLAAI